MHPLIDEHRVIGHLGSGQFGTVGKGVWTTYTDEQLDVAIKTLYDTAAEQDEVRFLQEVAIIGQFHHPNIVEMYGVVTIGNPVSYNLYKTACAPTD